METSVPDDEQPLETAVRLLAEGHAGEAAVLLQSLVGESHGGLLARLTLARAWTAAGETQNALAVARDTASLYPDIAEAPRYSCALGGAYVTALAVNHTAPILHSGAGCGLGQQFGQNYAGGMNAAGRHGNTSTP